MTDNNEATTWNAVLGGGGIAPDAPSPKDCQQTVGPSRAETMAIAVGATLAGFVTGVFANNK